MKNKLKTLESLKTSQAGIAAWFMVITIVLAVGSLIAYLIMKARYDGMLEHQKQRQVAIREVDRRIEEIKLKSGAVHEPVGLKQKKEDAELTLEQEDIDKVIELRDKERLELIKEYFLKSEHKKVDYEPLIKKEFGTIKKTIRVRESAEAAELEAKLKKEEEKKKAEEEKAEKEKEKNKPKGNGEEKKEEKKEAPPKEGEGEKPPKEGNEDGADFQDPPAPPPGQPKPAAGAPEQPAQTPSGQEGEERKITERNIDKDVKETYFLSTLKELPALLLKEILLAEDELRKAKLDQMMAKIRRDEAEKRLQNVPKQFPPELEKYNQIIQQLDEEIRRLDEYYKNQKDIVQNRLNEVRPKAKEANDKHIKEKDEITKRIAKMDAEIHTEIIRASQQIKPKQIRYIQGRILNPDMQNKFAYINLGSTDGAFTDLRFVVGREGPKETFVEKGEVTVTKVWPNRSEVRIEKIYDRNKPIVEDDLLLNPLWSRDSENPLKVVFIGMEALPIGPFPYELERKIYTFHSGEAKRKLMVMGVQLQDRVDIYTDLIVVVGKPEAWEEKIQDAALRDAEKAKLDRARLFGLDNDITRKDAEWAFPYLGLGDYSKVK